MAFDFRGFSQRIVYEGLSEGLCSLAEFLQTMRDSGGREIHSQIGGYDATESDNIYKVFHFKKLGTVSYVSRKEEDNLGTTFRRVRVTVAGSFESARQLEEIVNKKAKDETAWKE